ERERTSCLFGRPSIARSMGYVTSCSTSLGGSDGASVTTTTWLFVRSGKASTGIVYNAYPPAASRTTMPINTSQRYASVKSMMRFSISLLAFHCGFQELRFQDEASSNDHLLASFEPVEHWSLAAC